MFKKKTVWSLKWSCFPWSPSNVEMPDGFKSLTRPFQATVLATSLPFAHLIELLCETNWLSMTQHAKLLPDAAVFWSRIIFLLRPPCSRLELAHGTHPATTNGICEGFVHLNQASLPTQVVTCPSKRYHTRDINFTSLLLASVHLHVAGGKPAGRCQGSRPAMVNQIKFAPLRECQLVTMI